MNLPNYSFLLVVACFWLAYWVVNRKLVVPILAVLEEREKRVASGKLSFRDAKEAAEMAMRQRENELAQAIAQAQKERLHIRALGEQVRREKLEKARREAQQRLAMFMAELERETGNARKRLPEAARMAARELATKLLGRALPS